jgi:hypothetical protein
MCCSATSYCVCCLPCICLVGALSRLFYILFAALPCVHLVCSAAAAASASALLGPELLSHIRLPGWSQLLPAPTPAAAAATLAQQQQQQPDVKASVWWLDSSSSSRKCSAAPTYNGSCVLRNAGPSNPQWLHAIELATAAAAAAAAGDVSQAWMPPAVCDSCGSSLYFQEGVQPYICQGCGVARYCSSSCAADDRSQHAAYCRWAVCCVAVVAWDSCLCSHCAACFIQPATCST